MKELAVSLFLEYVSKIEQKYGNEVAQRFLLADKAITIADGSDDDDEAFDVRVKEITDLVDVFNKAGGLPQHKLSIERYSPKSVRVILSGPYGVVWRCYVFQDDFIFSFTQVLANSLPAS